MNLIPVEFKYRKISFVYKYLFRRKKQFDSLREKFDLEPYFLKDIATKQNGYHLDNCYKLKNFFGSSKILDPPTDPLSQYETTIQ